VPLLSLEDAEVLNDMIITSIVPEEEQKVLLTSIDDKVNHPY
jgi:hypothetical protein